MKKLFFTIVLLWGIVSTAQIQAEKTGGQIFEGYTTTTLNGLSTKPAGLLVRNTTDNNALWYWNGSEYKNLLSGAGIDWSTPVDANIVPDTEQAYNLGSPSKQFSSIYATAFEGGQFNGSGFEGYHMNLSQYLTLGNNVMTDFTGFPASGGIIFWDDTAERFKYGLGGTSTAYTFALSSEFANYVNLTTNQTIAGNKTFTGNVDMGANVTFNDVGDGTIILGSYPAGTAEPDWESTDYDSAPAGSVMIGTRAGLRAGYRNIGSVAIGYEAGNGSGSTESTAIGFKANSGVQDNYGVTAIGYMANQNLNSGTVAIGHRANQNSWGTDVAIGRSTARYSYGFGSLPNIAVGSGALQYNVGHNNVVVGSSFKTFDDDTSRTATFNDVDYDSDGGDQAVYITVTSHGFGNADAYVSLKYSSTGTGAIQDLDTDFSNGQIYLFQVVDANTLQYINADKRDDWNRVLESRTSHTLTPSKHYQGVNIFGNGITPDRDFTSYFAGTAAKMPNATIADIDAVGDKALPTVEWVEAQGYGVGSGEVNTAGNLGGGETIIGPKVGAELKFKSFVAGTNVTLDSDTNTITINSTGGTPADGSITNAKLADAAVTSTKILDNTILNADINSGAGIDATKLIDGSITNAELGYINTLTSNAQTQISAKAPINNPTLTGNVVVPDADADGEAVNLGQMNTAVNNAALLGAQSLTATRMGLLADANGVIEGNNASNITYTVPNNSTVAHPIGTILYFEQIGSGDIIMDYESGVTGEAMKTFGVGFTLSIRKTATNTWKVQNASPAYVTQVEYDGLSTAIKNNVKMEFNIVP